MPALGSAKAFKYNHTTPLQLPIRLTFTHSFVHCLPPNPLYSKHPTLLPTLAGRHFTLRSSPLLKLIRTSSLLAPTFDTHCTNNHSLSSFTFIHWIFVLVYTYINKSVSILYLSVNKVSRVIYCRWIYICVHMFFYTKTLLRIVFGNPPPTTAKINLTCTYNFVKCPSTLITVGI